MTTYKPRTKNVMHPHPVVVPSSTGYWDQFNYFEQNTPVLLWTDWCNSLLYSSAKFCRCLKGLIRNEAKQVTLLNDISSSVLSRHTTKPNIPKISTAKRIPSSRWCTMIFWIFSMEIFFQKGFN